MIYALHKFFKTRVFRRTPIGNIDMFAVFMLNLIFLRGFTAPNISNKAFMIIIGSAFVFYVGLLNYPYLFTKNIITIVINDKFFPRRKFVILKDNSRVISFAYKKDNLFRINEPCGIKFENSLYLDVEYKEDARYKYLFNYLERKFDVRYLEFFKRFIREEISDNENQLSLSKKLILKSFEDGNRED